MKFNYYKDQLNRLGDSEYNKSLKVFDGQGQSTNQVDLNAESIPVLIDYLKKELKKLEGKQNA